MKCRRALAPLLFVLASALAACSSTSSSNGNSNGGGIGTPVFAEDHPRIYVTENKSRLQALIAAEDPAATRFVNDLNNRVDSDFDDLMSSGFHIWYFALMAQLSGDSEYCRVAIRHMDDFVSSEEALMPDTPVIAGDSYLEVGFYLADVLLTYDWCFDHPDLTEDMKTRWLAYADHAVWNVWNPDDATWGGAWDAGSQSWTGTPQSWSGWSIDNPVNNYYYSFLRATMLLGLAAHGEYSEADKWIDKFRDDKIGDQLVPTFNEDLIGGGSREGAGYGTAMMNLFEIYDFWKSSTGEDISQLTSHTRSSLLNMIHMVVPTRDRISLTGDHARDQTAAFFDYHRHYIQTLAYLLGDDPLAARGYWLIEHSSLPEMSSAFMFIHDFLYAKSDAVTPEPLDGLNTAYYASGTGQTYLRSDWDTDATWVQFSAGPYTESHAHQDQGSFLIYKDEWLAYDPNYHSHSGIEQEVPLHNLVKIVRSDDEVVRQWEGGVSEVTAVTQGALANGENWFHVAADITPVYTYREEQYPSDLTSVQRELVYVEPDVVIVFDRVNSDAGTDQVWQLNSPFNPTVVGTRSTFTGSTNTMRVERVIPASVSSTSVFHWTAEGFDDGHRLDETIAGGGNNQFLHVIWMNTAVTSATRSDAGGLVGTSIALADGRTATVRFSTATNGTAGHLTITGGSGGGVDTDLTHTVHALPEEF